MPAAAILNFFRSQICNGPNGHDGLTASPCQILLKLWPRYGDFSIFENGGGRHVGLLKLQSSNCGTHHKCWIASPCQISWRLVKPLSRRLVFGFLMMLALGSHKLGFLKFYILTIRTVKKDELRHCAKFCRNRSIHGGDMSVFDFQDGGHHHLGFLKFQIFNGRDSQEGQTASSC